MPRACTEHISLPQVRGLCGRQLLVRALGAKLQGLGLNLFVLPQVRGLCGRQLLVRALGAKVAARQHQLRRAFAGGGGPEGWPAPGASVQLAQGDSWANTGILANPLAAQH